MPPTSAPHGHGDKARRPARVAVLDHLEVRIERPKLRKAQGQHRRVHALFLGDAVRFSLLGEVVITGGQERLPRDQADEFAPCDAQAQLCRFFAGRIEDFVKRRHFVIRQVDRNLRALYEVD